MRGTVVELGPGTGVNMRYYAPGTRVIAIEPNPVMHPPLQSAADEHDVDLEIRQLDGASVDVADASVDGVVGTLLLCGVDDPAQVISEAHRLLKPGATYFFMAKGCWCDRFLECGPNGWGPDWNPLTRRSRLKNRAIFNSF